MNPCPSLLQSYLSFNVLEGSPWLGLVATGEQPRAMPVAAPRLPGVTKALRFVLRRTTAVLQSWEAALADHEPDCRGRGMVHASNMLIDAAAEAVLDAPRIPNRESVPSVRALAGEYTCPRCSIRFVHRLDDNGNGTGKHEEGNALPEYGEVVALVEKALRRLFDFAYLGESPLASWEIVRRLAVERQNDEAAEEMALPGAVTHVDRGKALYALLVQALKTLRPDGKPPDRHAVPARVWWNFLILHESYVEGELNRNIMARLYIGEGTFNRARRGALEAVAKALLEMEEAARQERSEE